MGLAIDFKFDVRQLQNTYKWIGTFESVVEKPDVMDVGVKFIGRNIERNFNKEGTPAMGGGWAPLAAYTQVVRRDRGYNPEHPILQQTGELKDVVASPLANWKVGTQNQVASGRGIGMVAWTGPLSFQAKISGRKVANHHGGTMPASDQPASANFDDNNPGYLPARPFFALNQSGVIQARDAITRKIMTDWAARSGQTKRI